jgi:subtilase family serine protease
MMNMRTQLKISIALLSAIAFLSIIPAPVSSQSSAVPSRITAAINPAQLTVLVGNTHPMARAQFDRGAAPASLALDHVLLVLKGSPQQEAALETLLAQQQDRSSPNYHKWLTPEQFGQQFGPSDQDVQKVTSWLQSQGFQVNMVTKGKTTIDFSGTAGQVQQAFHTTIHRYVLSNGEEHWANATNPEIPTAFVPVVAGVESLNNFRRKPMSHSVGPVERSMKTGKTTRVHPQFTFAGDCYGTSTNCYTLGPGDFDTIYNVTTGNTGGTGQTIAIVSDSDVSETDLADFRQLFGLPALTVCSTATCTGSYYRQVETGTDPGIEPCSMGGDECEAALDTQWAGAAAPGAAINLVVSESTSTTFGGDTSAQYIINCPTVSTDCPFAVPAGILSYSYGTCEFAAGTSGNTFYNSLWSQAASEGITVVVATGDTGSAGCDAPFDPSNPNPVQPAVNGLAVTGQASTPFDVAVGGTDFDYANFSNPSQYWNASNNGTSQASAIGYIPEMTYNDSCTSSVIYSTFLGFSSAEAACNSATAQNDGVVAPGGGGGGASACTSSNFDPATGTGSVTSCTGGYAKPIWQTGPGVPNDGKRDLPDLSFFAGDGTVSGSFYIYCEQDLNEDGLPCSLTYPAGIDPSTDEPYADFQGVGGTSVSAQAFAGIAALIDQKLGGLQGNLNPMMYSLAGQQATSSCNSSGPASSCVFNDVTVGTNSQPCQALPAPATPNCTTTGTNEIGLLEINGVEAYNAGTGFDLASGLGSMNVANFLGGSGPNFYLSSTAPAITLPSAGGSATMAVTVNAVNNLPSENIAITFSGLPSGVSCSASPTPVAIGGGTASNSTTVTCMNTAAALLAPFIRPGAFGGGHMATISMAAALTFAMAGILLLGVRDRERFWGTAFVLIAFAFVLATAGCGGSSSTPPPTPTPSATTANVVGADGSGRSFTMNFTIAVQ